MQNTLTCPASEAFRVYRVKLTCETTVTTLTVYIFMKINGKFFFFYIYNSHVKNGLNNFYKKVSNSKGGTFSWSIGAKIFLRYLEPITNSSFKFHISAIYHF